MPDQYDVVIVGAGLVGSSAACCLAAGGLRVALLERSPLSSDATPAEALRVSAINIASQQIFRSLGVWEGICALGASPFRHMQVWDAGGRGTIEFDCADLGRPYLGHIIGNHAMQTVLIEKLRWGDTEVISPAAIDRFDPKTDAVDVYLTDGRRLQTRLLIGADGGRSRVRALAGIDTQGWGYQQKAIVATVSTALPHQETAWQRFLPTGPLAFLPLADGRCSIVWSADEGLANSLMAQEDTEFMRALAEAFGHQLGEIVEVSRRSAFPLRLQHSHRYVAPRIALIGDAAHTIHPLAGQGANLGLLDAAVLAEVLCECAEKGRDIGALAVLRRYERWRKGENMAMMMAMDGFKRLFAARFPPVPLLRNLGLSVTNAMWPIKHGLMRRAMGITGDLPRSARTAHI